MMKEKLKIKVKNEFNEKLDVVIEGNLKADASIIFVHGFGMNKDENGLFIDLSKSLQNKYRLIRFDLSGCGNSEGKQEEINCSKHAADLRTIIEYTRAKYDGELNIIAHSMGTFVVLMLSPQDISRTVFTGIPNPNINYQLDNLKRKILSRAGGIVNEEGISIYPRTTGELQRLGPVYWQSLRRFDPLDAIKSYSLKTDLIVFRPLQDEVISDKGIDEYNKIKSLRFVKLDGDHSFTKQKDRENLVKNIHEFFE